MVAVLGAAFIIGATIPAGLGCPAGGEPIWTRAWRDSHSRAGCSKIAAGRPRTGRRRTIRRPRAMDDTAVVGVL